MPLLDGTNRLGVIGFDFDHEFKPSDQRFEVLSTIAATLITGNDRYSDSYEILRRREEMSFAAEMQWALLPPLTLSTTKVTVSGILEPAYEVGGDAFDYALDGDTLHIIILDAMGHGTHASLMSTVTMGMHRHSRRQNLDLITTYKEMNEMVIELFGEGKFVTAQLCTLDCKSGLLRWINAGHPEPMLIRGGHTVLDLEGASTLPLGVGRGEVIIRETQLEPHDRMMFITDGVTEMRQSGEEFGRKRLADYLLTQSSSGHLAAETLRRISHAISEYHNEKLQDDATLVFLEWHGDE